MTGSYIARICCWSIACCAGLYLSCARLSPEQEWNNPFDPDGTNYCLPRVQPMADTVVGIFDSVTLHASGTDGNGTVTGFRWSFDRGATWETVSTGGALKKSWGREEAGKHVALVCAIDNDGLFSIPDSCIVDVHVFPPAVTPMDDSVVSQRASVAVNFKASDTNGPIVKYLWGSKETGWDDSASAPNGVFALPDGGPLRVRWAAIDDDGNAALDTFTILFNRGPRSAAISNPPTGTAAPFISYDFVEESGNIRLELSADDPDGPADTITYTLFLGQPGGAPAQVYSGTGNTYTAAGIFPTTQYSWILRARDRFGDSVQATGALTIAQSPSAPKGMKLVRSKAKRFSMGQDGFDASEAPVHAVSFSGHIWIDSVEVTAADFCAALGLQSAAAADMPVTGVSWYDAALYCNARSKRDNFDTVYRYERVSGKPGEKCTLEGLVVRLDAFGYRLPTEAEWEYACRGGSNALFYWGNERIESDKFAWVKSNAGNAVHAGAAKTPNAFGLYDMAGNVWEWCNDWFSADYYEKAPETDPAGPAQGAERAIRSGSWINSDYFAQCGTRSKLQPQSGNAAVGFRAVLPNK